MPDITPQDKGEYDYEGDMAKSQLKSIIANSKRMHDMLKPESNLPEWVQNKITLAEDYILTAANYMEGEMNEEMKPYVKRAQQKFDVERRAQELEDRAKTKQAGTIASRVARKAADTAKSAVVAQKAIDIAKGKKNKINMKPNLDGEKDANLQ
jgi:hypothetical protein